MDGAQDESRDHCEEEVQTYRRDDLAAVGRRSGSPGRLGQDESELGLELDATCLVYGVIQNDGSSQEHRDYQQGHYPPTMDADRSVLAQLSPKPEGMAFAAS